MYELPTRKECMELLREYAPENIINHCLMVNKVAVLLAEKLKASGLEIDVNLVDRASLLHDLDKMMTLKKKEHGKITEKILTDLGYPMLGRTAKRHKAKYLLKNLTWEEKIVNYADRRVLHDKIVSLDKRFDDGWERYKEVLKKKRPELRNKTKQLETEIFKRIDIEPEDI